MNKTQVKLLGGLIGGVFLLLLITSTFRNLFVTNNQGYYQIKQAAFTGEMTMHNLPGTYGGLFGEVTTYHVSDMLYFSNSKLDGESTEATDPIEVRFNGGGTAKVSGTMKF